MLKCAEVKLCGSVRASEKKLWKGPVGTRSEKRKTAAMDDQSMKRTIAVVATRFLSTEMSSRENTSDSGLKLRILDENRVVRACNLTILERPHWGMEPCGRRAERRAAEHVAST